MADISKEEARRIALAAQGFYAPLPARPGAAAVRKTVDRLNLLQIDSVNVLVRSHYLPLYSRLKTYSRECLIDQAWGPYGKRAFFEYWAHEASIVPLALQPLFRWRMERAQRGLGMWGRMTQMRRKKKFINQLYDGIINGGPAPASAFKVPRLAGSWWSWSEAKVGLEYLFWAGLLTTGSRTNGFERIYDLPERVFPKIVALPTPPEDEAHRQLVRYSLRAMGVATERDLRDYFRLDLADARAAVAALTESGAIEAVTVDGWKQQAYMLPGTRIPRSDPNGTALLSPFDSLIWFRERAHRLFDFHYRIEIYTPAHKRVHGYYVLPLLHDGKLIGRADLKADRQSKKLLLQSKHFEAGVPQGQAESALRVELETLATWLGLHAP